MDVQEILLGGIGAVTGALVWSVKILFKKSEDCEIDRVALRKEIEAVKTANGIAAGELKAFNLCPGPACPFKQPVSTLRIQTSH